jgi:hypothetical protein
VNQPRAESARWLTLLRPSTQQPRTAPVIDGVLRLIANHHDLAIFKSTPEVRALCSAGITRLQRSYDPVRLPPVPPPVATLRPLPSPMTGLPRLPASPSRRAVPTTPADRAGACVDCFPARAAFPKWQEGRHPHCHFRGLLRLHSHYARRIAQPPKATFVTRLRPVRSPGRAARQLPDQSTILRVESSSTGDPRLRGALPRADIGCDSSHHKKLGPLCDGVATDAADE